MYVRRLLRWIQESQIGEDLRLASEPRQFQELRKALLGLVEVVVMRPTRPQADSLFRLLRIQLPWMNRENKRLLFTDHSAQCPTLEVQRQQSQVRAPSSRHVEEPEPHGG